MTDKYKTTQVPVMLQEAQETGLISEETEQALAHERLLSEEKIEQLRVLYRSKLISHPQLEMGIRSIRLALKNKIIELGLEDVT